MTLRCGGLAFLVTDANGKLNSRTAMRVTAVDVAMLFFAGIREQIRVRDVKSLVCRKREQRKQGNSQAVESRDSTCER